MANEQQKKAIGVPNIPVASVKEGPNNNGYQSQAAKERAEETPEEDTSEPAPAATSVAVDMSQVNRMVKVRPRVTIPRTRIGLEWYSFTANKETLVPAFVRQHLEEKGIL